VKEDKQNDPLQHYLGEERASWMAFGRTEDVQQRSPDIQELATQSMCRWDLKEQG
jgi:hypothetical protein